MDAKLEFRCDVMKTLKHYRTQQEQERNLNCVLNTQSRACSPGYALNSPSVQPQQTFLCDGRSLIMKYDDTTANTELSVSVLQNDEEMVYTEM